MRLLSEVKSCANQYLPWKFLWRFCSRVEIQQHHKVYRFVAIVLTATLFETWWTTVFSKIPSKTSSRTFNIPAIISWQISHTIIPDYLFSEKLKLSQSACLTQQHNQCIKVPWFKLIPVLETHRISFWLFHMSIFVRFFLSFMVLKLPLVRRGGRHILNSTCGFWKQEQCLTLHQMLPMNLTRAYNRDWVWNNVAFFSTWSSLVSFMGCRAILSLVCCTAVGIRLPHKLWFYQGHGLKLTFQMMLILGMSELGTISSTSISGFGCLEGVETTNRHCLLSKHSECQGPTSFPCCTEATSEWRTLGYIFAKIVRPALNVKKMWCIIICDKCNTITASNIKLPYFPLALIGEVQILANLGTT